MMKIGSRWTFDMVVGLKKEVIDTFEIEGIKETNLRMFQNGYR